MPARRRRPDDPFARAFGEALDAAGLGLDRVRLRLADRGIRVSTATLSHWRSGRSRPERPDSLRALAILERLFGLPPGTFLARLGPRRPRGRPRR